MADLPAKSIVASNFRKFEKNTLQGFVDITLAASGMTIKEVSWHLKNDKEWIGLPGKPILVDGKQSMDETTGKPRYAQFILFSDRTKSDIFQRLALAAIHDLVG